MLTLGAAAGRSPVQDAIAARGRLKNFKKLQITAPAGRAPAAMRIHVELRTRVLGTLRSFWSAF